MPRFLGFEYVCAINTYNRGMAQDMIFDLVGLAQPHEYSWPAAPYQANIRTSIQHKKNEAISSQTSGLSVLKKIDHVFFLFNKSSRIGVLIRNFLVRKKKCFFSQLGVP